MGFIDLGQQFDICPGVASGETMASAGSDPYSPRCQVAAHQERKLRSAQPRHLPQVARQQAPHSSSLPCVLLLA